MVTFNVRGMTSKKKQIIIRGWIINGDFDLVLLTETKAKQHKLNNFIKDIRSHGYYTLLYKNLDIQRGSY